MSNFKTALLGAFCLLLFGMSMGLTINCYLSQDYLCATIALLTMFIAGVLAIDLVTTFNSKLNEEMFGRR